MRTTILFTLLMLPFQFSWSEEPNSHSFSFLDQLVVKTDVQDFLPQTVSAEISVVPAYSRRLPSDMTKNVLINSNGQVEFGSSIGGRQTHFPVRGKLENFPFYLFLYDKDGFFKKKIPAKLEQNDVYHLDLEDAYRLSSHRGYDTSYIANFNYELKPGERIEDFNFYVGFDPFMDAKLQNEHYPKDDSKYEFTRLTQDFYSLGGYFVERIVPDSETVENKKDPVEGVRLHEIELTETEPYQFFARERVEYFKVHQQSWKVDRNNPPEEFRAYVSKHKATQSSRPSSWHFRTSKQKVR